MRLWLAFLALSACSSGSAGTFQADASADANAGDDATIDGRLDAAWEVCFADGACVCKPRVGIVGGGDFACCEAGVCLAPDAGLGNAGAIVTTCPPDTACHEADDGYYWSCYKPSGCTSWCSGSALDVCP